jgi:alkylated DNA repair dioxygenase AlkB
MRQPDSYAGFQTIDLGGALRFHTGRAPAERLPSAIEFDRLWSLHPTDYHEIVIHGRPVKTPRWQQAYGRDYHYTNQTNTALPVPAELSPWLDWVKQSIDDRLNGILLNWYDGALGHYIGKHRDSTANMIVGAPIVTISLGETRLFRLRQWKGDRTLDFQATSGTVFVLPFDTNQAWTHEVPKSTKYTGKRISLTFRGFE